MISSTRELFARGNYSDRTSMDGPRVELGAMAAQTLALALHELATNAVKYGARGQPASSAFPGASAVRRSLVSFYSGVNAASISPVRPRSAKDMAASSSTISGLAWPGSGGFDRDVAGGRNDEPLTIVRIGTGGSRNCGQVVKSITADGEVGSSSRVASATNGNSAQPGPRSRSNWAPRRSRMIAVGRILVAASKAAMAMS